VTSVLLMTNILPGTTGRVLYETRTFFGTLRVTADRGGIFHVLRHGTTTHGRQDRRGAVRRRLPLSYYHVRGPIGQLVGRQRTWKRPLRVGVVGLGTGTMAAYAEKGDEYVFYEIDGAVVRIAKTPAWFSYLADSAVQPRIVLGDARLSLAHSPSERFDLLLLDAFSSDSIPVHLVTREAFEIYKRHLGPEGLIVAHVSNRLLEIGPTIASIARSVGLEAVEQASGISPEVAAQGYAASRWVAAGTREALRANALPTDAWRTSPPSTVRPWTDDYSNLAGVIVWRRSLSEE
jgi:spermidine synthase